MVRTVGQAPDWASTLDRPAYLQFLAALQRWLAVNGPGMVRGPELRLVHPRRSIELRPVVDAVRDAPDLYDAHYGLAVLEQDAGNADEAHDQALIAMDLAKNDDVRFRAAQGIAGRVSRFLTRPSKVPALRIE